MMNQRKVGALLSYVAQAIHILTGLIYTPVMLRLLGQSEYGLYQLVYSVVSYLGLFSLGFGAAYVRFYSRYKAKDDNENIAKLNGMFFTIFAVISVITIICGSIMVMNIKSIFGDGLNPSELDTARTLMIILVVNMAMTFITTVFDCQVTAHEKFVFQKVVTVLQYLFNPLLTLPLLLMGYGSVAMVVVTTLLTLLKMILNILFCFKKLQVKFAFHAFKFSLLKEMWVFTFYIFLNQIIDQVNWSVDKFLLGRYLGTVSVAIYGLASTINSMYLSFSTAVSNVFVPKVNMIVAKSESVQDTNNDLSILFTKVGRVQFIILSLIVSGFIFLGKPFMALWGGEGYSDSYYITLLLIIPVTVPLVQNLGIEIQRAKNMHKARSIVYLCLSIGNVFLSIPLIKEFGAIGAALGTAISLTLGNIFFMNWYYYKRIGLDILDFWKNIFSFLPAFIVPTILGLCIIKFVYIDSWTKLLLAVVIYTLVFCISIWFFGMNKYEKKLITSGFEKIKKKRSTN